METEQQPSRKRRLRVKNVQLESYTDEELAYYNKLGPDEQTNIAKLEKKMLDMSDSAIPARFKVLQSPIDDKIKSIAMSKLDELSSLCTSSGEYYKINHYMQSLCRIPFGKYQSLPVTKGNREESKEFISKIKHSLDDKVYGHTSAKDQIIRLLAQWISNPESKGLVIGIQGSMGTGKTTLIKDAICEALGLPFAFVPLGGVSDGSFLVGHGYTYEGSTWGKIVDILMRCECMNPVFFFDELDKVSCTHHGDEIINILIHMTDAIQNAHFHDKYFSNLEFDLSRSLIIFSYNEESNIHPVLKDRMVRINTAGYKLDDKIAICEKHMINSVLHEFGFPEGHVIFSKEILKEIIGTVETEEGVRNLRRALHDIISNINLTLLLEENMDNKPVQVTSKHVHKFLPKSKDDSAYKMMYM